jgi:hypothetical protein
VAGNGTGVGTPTLKAYTGGGVFSRNALIGASANSYPSDNFFPSNVNQVGFVDYGAGNFALGSSSAYKGAGTDSKDLGSGVATSASSAPSNAIPTGWVNIISKNSGKCMDVINQSTAPGANLIQYDCWGGDNQKFLFTPVSGGYKVTAKHSGLQLDVWGGTEDGPPIAQWTYWGGPNEIFQLNPTSDGYYSINPVSSGKCFDVAAISRDNGAPVIQWTCWGGDNQKWRFVPVQ